MMGIIDQSKSNYYLMFSIQINFQHPISDLYYFIYCHMVDNHFITQLSQLIEIGLGLCSRLVYDRIIINYLTFSYLSNIIIDLIRSNRINLNV